MKKIYIIGSVGSGKTTLARKLSLVLGIKMYELDRIVWDDDDNRSIKRTDEEISILFNEILKEDSWIIEDVGRRKFIEGVRKADIVYYINLNSFIIYKRCILRWIKQKLKLEKYNYKPTIKSLFEMLGWAKKDIKNKNDKIDYIKENSKKYKILTRHDIKEMSKSS